MDEPLEHRLAVIPKWVRQQLEDAAGLLSEVPERAKTEFQRLGKRFIIHRIDSTCERGRRPALKNLQLLPCPTTRRNTSCVPTCP